jgi:hypothetical protein
MTQSLKKLPVNSQGICMRVLKIAILEVIEVADVAWRIFNLPVSHFAKTIKRAPLKIAVSLDKIS